MIKFSELWKEEDTRIEFWLSTNKTFQLKKVSPDLVASFFEVRVAVAVLVAAAVIVVMAGYSTEHDDITISPLPYYDGTSSATLIGSTMV